MRQDSDLDLAVLLDGLSNRLPRGELRGCIGVQISVDILEMTPESLSNLALRLNSVHRDIVEDGIVLYRRAGTSPYLESPLYSGEELMKVKFDEVNLLLKKATSDEDALNFDGLSPQIAAFHGQQAVEKLLKAWLIALDIAPPKTHELDELEDILKSVGQSLPSLNIALKAFNDYAVRWRYADIPDSETIDLDGLRQTVVAVREYVRDRISIVLPEILLFPRA